MVCEALRFFSSFSSFCQSSSVGERSLSFLVASSSFHSFFPSPSSLNSFRNELCALPLRGSGRRIHRCSPRQRRRLCPRFGKRCRHQGETFCFFFVRPSRALADCLLFSPSADCAMCTLVACAVAVTDRSEKQAFWLRNESVRIEWLDDDVRGRLD